MTDRPHDGANGEERGPPDHEQSVDEEEFGVGDEGHRVGGETNAGADAANDAMSNGGVGAEVPTSEASVGGERAGERVERNGEDRYEEDRMGENENDQEDVEPVEVLVQLAKDGEIDPWDIDIVAVTDKFLEHLEAVDLRISGRALFYASVLLRMKSDELFAPARPEEPPLEPWEEVFDEQFPAIDPVASLEAEMERRLDRKHARGTPETLDELVRDLREAERGTWWKTHREYDTSNSPRGFQRGTQTLSYHAADEFRVEDEPTANDVTHTAHNEDIEAVILEVEAALEEQYQRGREEVLFAEVDETGGSRVLTYLALLFLAHRGRVRLEQDDLFGDLWIQRAAPEAEASEALAD